MTGKKYSKGQKQLCQGPRAPLYVLYLLYWPILPTIKNSVIDSAVWHGRLLQVIDYGKGRSHNLFCSPYLKYVLDRGEWVVLLVGQI